MYEKPNSELWSGRVDSEDGELGKRWHEKIDFLSYPYVKKSGIAFLGFECDEGVRRNKGRIGAAQGGDKLKKAMGGFAYHLENSRLYDAGKVVATIDLESSQSHLSLHVSKLIKNNHFPIILGGGHEVAYASYLGFYDSLESKKSIAIINFDAHFDLRLSDEATSGTPFAQIADFCQANNRAFDYMCLGISQAANTQALFKRAKDLHVRFIDDTKMTYHHLEKIKKELDNFLQSKEHIYITIDTDVFVAHCAPAVSAVAARGIEINLVYDLLEYLFLTYQKRIGLVDIAEFNPSYDINDIGCKTVARLIYDIVKLRDKR